MDKSISNITVGLSTYMATIVVVGILCFIIDVKNDYKKKDATHSHPLPAWNTGWLEFFIFLTYTFLFAMFIVLFVSSAYSFVDDSQQDTTWNAIIIGNAMHVAIIFAIATGHRIFPQIFNFSFNLKNWVHDSLQLAVFYFLAAIPALFAIAVGWNHLLTELAARGLADAPTQQSVVEMITQADGLWKMGGMACAAIILAPISEELLFRGCVYRFLKGKLKHIQANAITAFLFALLHMHTAAFLPLFLLGMLLCRCYEKTGNIYVCIILHALFNLNTFVIILI